MPATRELTQRMSEHWINYRDYIRYNYKILNIYSGQLKPYMEDAIRQDYSKPSQQKEMIQRTPTINILRSLVDKLAKVYVLPVSRVVTGDQEIFDKITHSIDLDTIMHTADEMLTLHKACFIEPFVDEGMLDLRVIPLDRALPYSDDEVNPLRPTAVMKLLGREKINKDDYLFSDDQGQILDTDDNQTKDILLCYTADSIWVMTGSGQVLKPEKLERYVESPTFWEGTPFAVNPFGKLPFAYLNRSKFSLVPEPDNDLYDMTLLIPKLFADLNYSVKYQANSIMVATDAVLPEAPEKAPNSILQIASMPNSDQQAKLDVLKPIVDIDSVLGLIQSQFIMWLEARGLRAGSVGKNSEQRASGLAKIIDSADATSERLAKIKILSRFEKRTLIPLLRDFYNFAIDTNDISIATNKPIDSNIGLQMIEFPDQRPLTSIDDRKMLALDLYDRSLATPSNVIDLIFPQMPQTEKEKWVDELKDSGVNLESIARVLNESRRSTQQETEGPGAEGEQSDDNQED